MEAGAVLIGGSRLMRDVICGLLEDRLAILAQAESLDGLRLDAWSAPPPQLLILLGGGPQPATVLVRQVKARWPRLRVVLLTGGPLDADGLALAWAAGIDACLSQTLDPAGLVHALQAVLGGNRLLSWELIAPPAAAAALPASAALPALTARQWRILEALADGWANKQIGRSLGLNEEVVKAQVRAILRKIGASNRTQAAIWLHERRGRGAVAPDGTDLADLAPARG